MKDFASIVKELACTEGLHPPFYVQSNHHGQTWLWAVDRMGGNHSTTLPSSLVEDDYIGEVMDAYIYAELDMLNMLIEPKTMEDAQYYRDHPK